MSETFADPYTRRFQNLSIILWYMGNLFVGINSSLTSFFIIGFIAQFWLRKFHPQVFVKYNYLVSAALDGGTQVLVFVFTFAVVRIPTSKAPRDCLKHSLTMNPINPSSAAAAKL